MNPVSSRSRARSILWLITPLITGTIIMVLEMAAVRLYAPFFGNAINVWAVVISIVMLALAIGYVVGGKLADRTGSDGPLFFSILGSSIYQLVTIYIARPALPQFADLGEVAGAGLATLAFFAIPMILLAGTGPYIIRLLSRADNSGTTAGSVYALSTAGSVAGIALASFVLIPRLGTNATLLISCAVSGAVGAAGLISRISKKRLSFASFASFASIAPLALIPHAATAWEQSPDTIWESESAYNVVRVARDDTRLLLKLNAEDSVHTVRESGGGWTGYYYDQFALGPLLVDDPRRALVLGMGAGSSIHATRVTAPNIRIDAVEIDAKVVEAAYRFFEVPDGADWLRIHVADARPWLRRNGERYEIIQIDLYRGGPQIPFYLATLEFYTQVREHLTDGVMMMNVFDASPDRRLVNSIAATLKQVFPSVMIQSAGPANYVVSAFARRTSVESIRKRLTTAAATANADQGVALLARNAAARITEAVVSPGTRIFTDDLTPGM